MGLATETGGLSGHYWNLGDYLATAGSGLRSETLNIKYDPSKGPDQGLNRHNRLKLWNGLKPKNETGTVPNRDSAKTCKIASCHQGGQEQVHPCQNPHRSVHLQSLWTVCQYSQPHSTYRFRDAGDTLTMVFNGLTWDNSLTEKEMQ